MADMQRQKTWLVKTFFSIPHWYVLSEYEEDKLFDIIVRDRPTTFEEAHYIRFLNCSAFCREEFCYFCSRTVVMCQKCIKASREN